MHIVRFSVNSWTANILPKCFCCTCPEWEFSNILRLNPPNIAPETMNIQILILPANSNVHRFLLIHYKPLEQDDRVCRFFSKFDPLNLIWQNCQEVKLLLASIGDQSLFALHNTNLNKKISHLRFKINAIIRDVGISENQGGVVTWGTKIWGKGEK